MARLTTPFSISMVFKLAQTNLLIGQYALQVLAN
jgi:hypothetical protein